jgi:hypothetical protein
MFKHFEELSPALNKGIQLYIERLDMTQRDRELFYDIINFTYLEGKIQGKEEYLTETSDFNNKSNEEKEK